MWIENAAAADIPQAFHYDPGPNSMLIQITDMGSWWPKPKYSFKEVHQFAFFDLEKGDEHWDEAGISEDQATQIAALLTRAKELRMNIVVHCMAGLCRSGGVCEAAIALGFEDTGKHRSPNLLVKHRIMKALGLAYDPDEPYVTESWGNHNFMNLPEREDGDV